MEHIPSWMARGRCRGAITTMYPSSQLESKAAQAVCRGGCPVRLECLVYALVHHEEHGVWGGYAEKERQTRRRELITSMIATPPKSSTCQAMLAEYAAKLQGTSSDNEGPANRCQELRIRTST